MLTFITWLENQDTATLLALLESRDYFEPSEYNVVFDRELDKLLDRINDPDARQQIAALRGFDWGNYVVRSLVRGGFRGDDVSDNFQSIVLKLLLAPGKLFKNWNPRKHGALERRFRASVWNAIRNLSEKRRNYRRWMVSADPTALAERNPAKQPYSGILDDFRKLVADRLGALAAAIFDWRLQGEDTKELVGRAELGTPTPYTIKREVQAIKALAHRFAAQSGDPAFLYRVEKALEGEAATVAKRQAARRI
jgi:hypothetical protein